MFLWFLSGLFRYYNILFWEISTSFYILLSLDFDINCMNDLTSTKLSTDFTVESLTFDVISFRSLLSHAFLYPSPLFCAGNASLVSRTMS